MRRGATDGGSGAEVECSEAPDVPSKRPRGRYVETSTGKTPSVDVPKRPIFVQEEVDEYARDGRNKPGAMSVPEPAANERRDDEAHDQGYGGHAEELGA